MEACYRRNQCIESFFRREHGVAPRSSETAEQRRISERTRSQRRRNVETNEQTAARLSAQRDYARCQRSCETLEQAYCRRAANRNRSHCRRITKTPGFRR